MQVTILLLGCHVSGSWLMSVNLVSFRIARILSKESACRILSNCTWRNNVAMSASDAYLCSLYFNHSSRHAADQFTRLRSSKKRGRKKKHTLKIHQSI